MKLSKKILSLSKKTVENGATQEEQRTAIKMIISLLKKNDCIASDFDLQFDKKNKKFVSIYDDIEMVDLAIVDDEDEDFEEETAISTKIKENKVSTKAKHAMDEFDELIAMLDKQLEYTPEDVDKKISIFDFREGRCIINMIKEELLSKGYTNIDFEKCEEYYASIYERKFNINSKDHYMDICNKVYNGDGRLLTRTSFDECDLKQMIEFKNKNGIKKLYDNEYINFPIRSKSLNDFYKEYIYSRQFLLDTMRDEFKNYSLFKKIELVVFILTNEELELDKRSNEAMIYLSDIFEILINRGGYISKKSESFAEQKNFDFNSAYEISCEDGEIMIECEEIHDINSETIVKKINLSKMEGNDMFGLVKEFIIDILKDEPTVIYISK